MRTFAQTPDRQPNPDFKHLQFTLNSQTGYFEMTRGEMGFTKVPTELKLEKTQRREQIRSEFLIQSRIVNGKRLFFTGLLNTGYENWFFGDFFEIRHGIKKNSFILFHFSQDRTRFEMYFFNHFKLYPDRRDKFIQTFIDTIKKRG